MNRNECQIPSLKSIAEGNARMPPQPPVTQVRQFIRRRLSLRQVQLLHKYADAAQAFARRLTGAPDAARPAAAALPLALQAGDKVRVRSEAQIMATLDKRRQLKGCTFMDEMKPFCSTEQRVLKPLARFVDERDLRLKKSRGLVLLEGVNCTGVAGMFGSCDRACFFFWREEWLEKAD